MSKIIDLVVNRRGQGCLRPGPVWKGRRLRYSRRQPADRPPARNCPSTRLATGDEEVSGDDFGLVYDHVWRVLNAHQSEWIEKQKMDGDYNGRRGWASSVDKGTYPQGLATGIREDLRIPEANSGTDQAYSD